MARSTKFNITIVENKEEQVSYNIKFIQMFVDVIAEKLVKEHFDEVIIKKDLKQNPAKIVSSQIILL